MNITFEQFIERKRREYGDKFDPSDLAQSFVPYFNSGDRIKVDFLGRDEESKPVYGHTVLTGVVGVTTGYKPVFLLMRTTRSLGSSLVLTPQDRIIAVKGSHGYKAVR